MRRGFFAGASSSATVSFVVVALSVIASVDASSLTSAVFFVRRRVVLALGLASSSADASTESVKPVVSSVVADVSALVERFAGARFFFAVAV